MMAALSELAKRLRSRRSLGRVAELHELHVPRRPCVKPPPVSPAVTGNFQVEEEVFSPERIRQMPPASVPVSLSPITFRRQTQTHSST